MKLNKRKSDNIIKINDKVIGPLFQSDLHLQKNKKNKKMKLDKPTKFLNYKLTLITNLKLSAA